MTFETKGGHAVWPSILAAALFGCGPQGGQNNATPHVATTTSTDDLSAETKGWFELQKLVIGLQVDKFEQRTGPPDHIDDDGLRGYTFGPCHIKARIDKQRNISSISVPATSDKCPVYLNAITGMNFVCASGSGEGCDDHAALPKTFGGLLPYAVGGSLVYSASCIIDCGGPHDPYVALHYHAPSLFDGLEVTLVGDAGEGNDGLRDWLRNQRGQSETYFSSGFNCDAAFQKEASIGFSPVTIDEVIVGPPRIKEEKKCGT